MGTDIHTVFQKKTPNGWEDIPHNYEEERHYFLFSWLAGVRNGYGFAGVPTYDPIVPISPPRGIPADFQFDDSSAHMTPLKMLGRRAEYYEDDVNAEGMVEYWMGDHSYSWLLGSEILSAPSPGIVKRVGVISREQYDAWDRISQPDNWCGDISGRDVRIDEHPHVNDDATHVRVTWMRDSLQDLEYFINEVKRLVELHGEIRIVFGFDS